MKVDFELYRLVYRLDLLYLSSVLSNGLPNVNIDTMNADFGFHRLETQFGIRI